MRNNKSQITIEYFLFIGLIILVLILVIGKKDSKVQQGVNKAVDNMGDKVTSLIH